MSVKKKSVVLPDFPKGKEFEEYISAYLQCAGYYIDRNIIERGLGELLELDIIITNYNSLPKPQLIEIKSGNWGFSDVFKIKGWMSYSGIKKAHLIVKSERENYEFYKSKAKKLNIRIHNVPNLENTIDYLNPLLKKKSIDKRDIETLRYSFWLERQMLKDLKSWKKTQKNKLSYDALEKYYFSINSGVFFTDNIIDRIAMLYENFKQNSRITAKSANELIGKNFKNEHNKIPNEIFVSSFYECKYSVLHVSTLFEYLSKMAILKNAIDFLLLKKTKQKRKTSIEFQNSFGLNKLDFLPQTFISGLEILENHKCFNRYAVFWQWFLYVFGGFIMLDFKEKEYLLLSKKTGVDYHEIDSALSAMDVLFPTSESWLRINKQTNILETKLFPMPFRGLGANYRRLIYNSKKINNGQYEDLLLKNDYAYRDLIKWNNMTVELLLKK